MDLEKIKKIHSYCSSVFDYARQLIFPRCCPVCQKIVIPKGEYICNECRNKLVYITEPCCRKCGKQLYTDEQEYCHDCRKKKFSFEYGNAVFLYNDKMQKSIAAFKFHGKKEYADFYAYEMARVYAGMIRHIAPDIIIPVPVHDRKLKSRGFNQAHLIAKKFAKLLDIDENPYYLIRTKDTLPQKQLNDEQRAKNIKDAFAIADAQRCFSAHYKKVLLIDDIYTTGSTIEACSKVLIEGGAEKVYFLCLCIGCGF